MVDIKKSKADISDNEIENLEALHKTRAKLEQAELEAIKKKDGKLLNSVKQQMKYNEKYIKNLEKQIKVQTEVNRVLKAGIKPSDDLMKSLQKNTQVVENDNKARKESLKKSYEEIEASKTRQDQYESEALKNFKNYTLTGKVLDSVGSKVSELAEKYSSGALAVQAFTRHVKATELRQNILIKTSKDLNDEIGKGFFDAAADIDKYDKALAKAEAHAKYLGMSVEEVAGTMERFSYITGVKNPKTLATLAEGANSVAKSLGITTSEALDFVSIRMEKFGGSAAGAIVTMDQLQKETTNINKAFGRTAVRGGDLVKSLMDISRQSNIYAIDQRFVGNILRENITRLQSMGDSYETANKKAMAFAKAVTGEAPEWMQVFAGQDLLGQITNSFNAGKFEEEFGAELEAAKPGLMKQVADVLGDKSMGYYSKLRLVEEMMRGTSVGAEAMNKQILKIASHPQGVELLAKQFNITRVEAQAMVEQAKNMETRTILLNKLIKAKNADEMASIALQSKRADITKAELEGVTKGITDPAKKKAELAQFLSDKDLKLSIAAEAERKKTEKENTQKRIQSIKRDILNLEGWKKEAEAGGNQDQAEVYEDRIKKAKAELTRTEAKETDKEDETEGLKTVEDINKEHLKKFNAYADHTGNYLKSILVGLGTTNTLLLASIAMGFGSVYLKKSMGPMFSGLMKHLATSIFKRTGGDLAGAIGKGAKEVGKEGLEVAGKEVAGKATAKAAIGMSKSLVGLTKFVTKFTKGIPLIGAGVSFAASKASGETTGKAASVAAGSLLGGMAFAKMGAAIGTLVAPGIGTAIGGLLGSIVGSLGGEKLFKWIYDKFLAGASWDGFLDSIIRPIIKFGFWIGDMFTGMWDGVKKGFNFLTGIADKMQKDGAGFIWDAIKDGLKSIGSGILRIFTKSGEVYAEEKKIHKGELLAQKKNNEEPLAKQGKQEKQEGGGNIRKMAESISVTKEEAERYSKRAKDEEQKYQRKTPISGTPISAESAAGLKLQRKEEMGEYSARRVAEERMVAAATANTTSQVASMQQQQQQTTGTGTGSFVSVNPDGSSTLRAEITINNHMAAVAQANTMIKQNSIRGPLG